MSKPYVMNGWEHSDCKRFSALHNGDKAYCTKVYDGDTITLCWMDDRGEKVRVLCQIRDIETPSLRGSENEKRLAYLAKEKMCEAVLYKYVTVINEGKAQYGKVLADICTSDIPSVSKHMLEESEICKPFGTKHKWD